MSQARRLLVMMNYNRSLKYLLENYLGLDKNVIEKKLNHDGRHFSKHIRCYFIQQKLITTISRLKNKYAIKKLIIS